MHIASRALSRKRRFAASLAIPRFAFSGYAAAKKNVLRGLRPRPSGFLRPQVAPGPGSVVWRHQSFPGTGSATRLVPKVSGREAGKLAWLADNPFYTKRFAFLIGRRCRSATLTDVAQEFGLDWKTVKDLEKQYMEAQLRRVGTPGPKVVGIDEFALRKGHVYRIVVSDLLRSRPIWFGGVDRSEQSLDRFFQELGPKKNQGIRLAVMDMWKAFRKSTLKAGNDPQAAILYDKFHIMAHHAKRMDKVRKSEYYRVAGADRRFIKGQRYNLLSHYANLSLEGKKSLKLLLATNRRLHKAYLLKESFGQFWDYQREGWARRFFDNWRAALRWQRLKPFEQFARMIEEHWDGVAAFCCPENKVPLGFVEGLNNKIRVIQRRAYGLRDEEYIRLKVLTCMLPEL